MLTIFLQVFLSTFEVNLRACVQYLRHSLPIWMVLENPLGPLAWTWIQSKPALAKCVTLNNGSVKDCMNFSPSELSIVTLKEKLGKLRFFFSFLLNIETSVKLNWMGDFLLITCCICVLRATIMNSISRKNNKHGSQNVEKWQFYSHLIIRENNLHNFVI